MKQIIYYPETKEFHLSNDKVSYLIKLLKNGAPAHLYFGARLPEKAQYGHFLQLKTTSHTAYLYEDDYLLSLDHARLEYPCYGSTDYRTPAFELISENGSHVTDFVYESHRIFEGKPALEGLPALYTDQDEEAMTLQIILRDSLLLTKLILSYTIFEGYAAIARSAAFVNEGNQMLHLSKAASMAVDLYDSDFELITLDGSWSRERYVTRRPLAPGFQGVDSTRGCSSAEHNPFLALPRPRTTETAGEVYGFSLLYSGNFQSLAEVDRFGRTRVLMGINPYRFDWLLKPGSSFQTPEAVLVYSGQGLNGMSQTLHKLYNRHLVRGVWREKARPALLNNWEGTYFDFDEAKLMQIAAQTKELGLELFVLDDGWFGHRDNCSCSLGDWYSDRRKLPDGVGSLAKKIHEMGLLFGLWFEPEMVNRDSDLYRAHPDWIIATPGRNISHGRGQYVLDFSRDEVVDHIYAQMEQVIREARVDYVKWDMNRDITEAYSASLGPDRQGEFFHRYILGVYRLYEKLILAFPRILFESCASGGARFDAGMLYYAPQAWTSDDTDAIERLKIQYGTSMAYPLSSISAHVSASPNHQVFRQTSLRTRAHVALFGDFGYELDPMKLTERERDVIRKQVQFFISYRELLQFGTFYRLKSPFEGCGDTAWMVVSRDRKQAILAFYKVLARPNPGNIRILLQGLLPEQEYRCSRAGELYFGEELMRMGFLPDLEFTGTNVRNDSVLWKDTGTDRGDFTSQMYVLEATM